MRGCLDFSLFKWKPVVGRRIGSSTQIVNADTEQPDRPQSCVGFVQEAHGSFGHLCFVACREAGVASRDGGEVAVADFESDSSSEPILTLEPLGGVGGHAGDFLANRRDVRKV